VAWFSRSMLWASSLVFVAQLERVFRVDCLDEDIVDVWMEEESDGDDFLVF